jgi:Protein of unknown function (DUF3987)
MHVISMTLFKDCTSGTGVSRTPDWGDLALSLTHLVGPKDGLAFACGTFTDNRRATKMALSRTMIGLDIERIKITQTGELGPQPPSVEVLKERVEASGFAAAIYTTYSHTPEAPRCRVIIPLDRPMFFPDGEDRPLALECDKEFAAILADELGLSQCVDASKFGISSIFFVPRCSEENLKFAQIELVEGEAINLDFMLEKAAKKVSAKNADRQAHAETVAKVAVARRASRQLKGGSLIERIRPHLPSMDRALQICGYSYVRKLNRWISPHSQSGTAGVVLIECNDGVDRIYIHNTSDPLCGSREVFGCKAHDALDLIIAHRFGTSEEDFRRGLKQLATEYGIDSKFSDADFDWSFSAETDDPPDEPTAEAAPDNHSDWSDPLPFITKTRPAEYPLESLPEAIRAPIKEVASFLKAPISMIASSALGAASLAIQAEVDVKRAEGLDGPCSLFLLTIADSGERKSSCDKLFSKGIRRAEEEAARKAKAILKKYEAEHQAWDVKIKGAKAQIQTLQKDGKPTEKDEAIFKILMEAEPKRPRTMRLSHMDTTSEELAHNLSQVWPSGGIISAEGGLVFGGHAMGKDAVMRTFSVYNLLWDGSPIKVDRRTSASFTIENARLTIVIQVQETTVRDFIRKNGELARGTGFFARFLISHPESTQGNRPFTEPPFFMAALEQFNDRLFDILINSTAIDDEGVLQPQMLSLSAEAKEAWIAFHNSVEGQLAIGGKYQDVRDVASKIADNCARVAAIFHVYDGTTGPISVDAVRSAQAIVQWHLDEALRFFREYSLPVELSDAMRVERWLITLCKRHGQGSVKLNDLRQKGPVREKKALRAALDELFALQRVRSGKEGRANVILVNPQLITED